MAGDQGQGTPRQILLSIPNAAGATPTDTPAPSVDEDADADQAPPLPTTMHPGFMGHGVHTAQQLEMQRQIDAQQLGHSLPPAP
jgi:hypothetical protein